MKNLRISSLILLLFITTQCANNRSYTGAGLGAVTTTAACLQVTSNPVVSATCAVTGAFIGADIMYKSDYDVHNAVFVDHLNNGTSSSYTNWHNEATGNSGIIKIYRSYTEEPFVCKDYSSTVDITETWPLIGIGGIKRNTTFGTACKMPDGRWIEKTQLTKQ
jgi:surface antigen